MTKAERLAEEIRAMLATNACAGCSCPQRGCAYHGKCYECVRIHRHYGEHLPSCLQFLLTDKLAALAEVAEVALVPNQPTPEEAWDRILAKRQAAFDSEPQ
jgi:hypothetical protein